MSILILLRKLWRCLPFYSRNAVDAHWLQGYNMGEKHAKGRYCVGLERDQSGRFRKST